MTEPDPLEPPAATATDRNRPGRPRRQHDAGAKLLFSHERTARELLAHVGALPKDRDVRLIKWSTEWIRLRDGHRGTPARLARELGDQVWLVCEMDGRPLGTVLLEFKADHDPDTARQITLYLFDLWQDARRLAALRTGTDTVPARAALVYTGQPRWTADLSLPAVDPDGTITPRPGIFLLDAGRTEPGIFPEHSLLAHIIPLERCRGRLQWARGVDETVVVAEASRLWDSLRPLAEGDDSLWQVLLDWLRAGFADYIQDTKWDERGEGYVRNHVRGLRRTQGGGGATHHRECHQECHQECHRERYRERYRECHRECHHQYHHRLADRLCAGTPRARGGRRRSRFPGRLAGRAVAHL